MALINVGIGNGETTIIDQHNANEGDTLGLSLGSNSTLIVRDVAVEVSNLIGVGAAGTKTFAAENGGTLTYNAGSISIGVADQLVLSPRAGGTINYTPPDISLNTNNTIVDYGGTSQMGAGKFSVNPVSYGQTYIVKGMQAGDIFEIRDEDSAGRVVTGAPTQTFRVPAGLEGSLWTPPSGGNSGYMTLVSSTSSTFLGTTTQSSLGKIYVRIEMTAEQWAVVQPNLASYISNQNNVGGFDIQSFTMPPVLAPVVADDTVQGTAGDDLMPADYRDADGTYIDGPDGIDDTIYGYGGHDTISGGEGHDLIYGGEGNDEIYGGAFNDTIYGDEGNDTLYGGTGEDLLYGGDGNDQISGFEGDDVIYGELGDDSLHGSAGNDTLYGDFDETSTLTGGGNDTLEGSAGDDVIYGGAGNDLIYGGADNDMLYGGAGNDRLYGGAGNDTISGGTGNDIMTGGTGNDLFVVSGADTITDFDATTGISGDGTTTYDGTNDFVDLSAFYNDQTLADWNAANPTQTYKTPLEWMRADYAGEIGDAGVLEGAGNLVILNGGNTIDASLFNGENTGVICFGLGTMILTITGEVAVENLKAGDLVWTEEAGFEPLLWVGSKTVTLGALEKNANLAPVTFKAGSLGQGLPLRDLTVTRQHRMAIKTNGVHEASTVIIPAKDFVGMDGVAVDRCKKDRTFWHLLFKHHRTLRANGVPAESLFDGELLSELVTPKSYMEIRALLGTGQMALSAPEVRGKNAIKVLGAARAAGAVCLPVCDLELSAAAQGPGARAGRKNARLFGAFAGSTAGATGRYPSEKAKIASFLI